MYETDNGVKDGPVISSDTAKQPIYVDHSMLSFWFGAAVACVASVGIVGDIAMLNNGSQPLLTGIYTVAAGAGGAVVCALVGIASTSLLSGGQNVGSAGLTAYAGVPIGLTAGGWLGYNYAFF